MNKLKNAFFITLKFIFLGYLVALTVFILYSIINVFFAAIAEEGLKIGFLLWLFFFCCAFLIWIPLVLSGFLGYICYRRNNKKRAFKLYIFWVFFHIFFFFILPHFPDFDQVGDCYKDGGVWDRNEERCRYDCKGWNKELGCIPLDKVIEQ